MLESTMLVISDDPTLIEPVVEIVGPIEGLRVAVLAETEGAHSYGSWDRVALVLIHLKRSGPDPGVVRLLRMISGAGRPVATVVVADRQDADQSTTLLRLGVADYLARPLDLARLAHLAEVLTVRTRDAVRGTSPSTTSSASASASASTTSSASASASASALSPRGEADDPILAQVRRIAHLDTTILLGGETGTGKTRLARQIHELSERRDGPFVVVNCGALTSGQVEAEMFGHVRGSTGGSGRDRPGKFAEVGRGTLFLDEIDALPLTLQPRLLRVVENRILEASRGGAEAIVPVRARLIAASNLDLGSEVEAGRFRSDLYYRLNVIGLHLPPLRERQESIPGLVEQFLAESSTGAGGKVTSISAPALRALQVYDWPGNVRELKNTIERAIALGQGGEIQLEDLPEAVVRGDLVTARRAAYRPQVAAAPSSEGSSTTLAEIKRDAEFARITQALQKHSNNRLRAASELGISRMTLYKKLYKYGLMHHSGVGRDNGN